MVTRLQDKAETNLQFIREAMERAERVSAVSGAGMMGMGALALAGGAMASRLTPDLQLLAWLVLAPVAALLGAATTWRKSTRSGEEPLRDPMRRFIWCLAPSLLAAAVFTALLWGTPTQALLPVLWLVLYGCGVLAAGTYAVPPVMHLGMSFIGAGLVLATLPADWMNTALSLAFGGLHLFFGWRIYKHHGG